jgi:sialic acid synthase SpsE
MSRTIQIAGKPVGDGHAPFVIAEIGANHDGYPSKARELVHMAAECGADAVKFQTYSAAELLADVDRVITWGPAGKERTEPIGAMFDRIALKQEDHAELFALARSLGVIPFSTPFSLDAATFLESLEVDLFKVASSDVDYHELLAQLARTGKPVILSLGKATLAEADAAVDALECAGATAFALLHCIAQYPAPVEELNLAAIGMLRSVYPGVPIGFSDHSVGTLAASLAVAMGASIIEKHITLDKATVGPDHWFSADRTELEQLCRDVRAVRLALGDGRKRVMQCETKERYTSTRSLVLAQRLDAGAILTREHLKVVRPGWGIAPTDIDKVVGMRLPVPLEAGTVLQWEHFKVAP